MESVELSTIMEAIEVFIKQSRNEADNISRDLISDDILQMLLSLLDGQRLSVNPEFLSSIYNIMTLIRSHHPDLIKASEEIGNATKLLNSLKKDREKGKLIFDQQNITTVHLIADFLPTLPQSECYKDVDFICPGVLLNGSQLFREINENQKIKLLLWHDEIQFEGHQKEWSMEQPHKAEKSDKEDDDLFEEERRRIIHVVGVAFKPVFSICQDPSCPFACHALLLKIIYWASAFKEMTRFVRIDEIIEYVKKLLSSKEQTTVIIGMAIVNTLTLYHMDSLRELRQLSDSACSMIGPRKWTSGICELLAKNDIWKMKSILHSIDDMTFSIEKRADLIRVMLELIMPNFGEKTGNARTDIERNYSHLTTFMTNVVDIPRINEHDGGRRPVDTKCFESAVAFVMRTLEVFKVDKIYKSAIRDMDNECFERPMAPDDIDLMSSRLTAFDKVLGPSLNPDQLRGNPLMQALRLISIFHAVNENWWVIFHDPSTERLIDRNAFISNLLTSTTCYSLAVRSIVKTNPLYGKLISNIIEYRFLLPLLKFQYLVGNQVFHSEIASSTSELVIPRNNLLQGVVKDLLGDNLTAGRCDFSFEGEPATGRGPTKEFYTEFSRYCQRYDLDLWIGDPVEDCSGVVYVNSACGLFPKPKISLDKESVLQWKAIGRIIARCILDGGQMDINFSKAFYKRLLNVPSYDEETVLSQIKYIVPHVHTIASKLFDVLKTKQNIEKDETLSVEERRQALSSITLDGSSLEDLDINFTVPGFPEIEMKEGGNDILLTIENVEEYLKLLVWWLMYKGPQKCFEAMTDGFQSTISDNYFHFVCVDELKDLFCDTEEENWTLEYLKASIIVNIQNATLVQYFFEVLSSMTAKEQSLFLQFATGLSRPPYGGLKNLRPQIYVMLKKVDGNPDSYLPSSATCQNLLHIPEYSCKEALKEKLLLAISEGQTFQYY